MYKKVIIMIMTKYIQRVVGLPKQYISIYKHISTKVLLIVVYWLAIIS